MTLAQRKASDKSRSVKLADSRLSSPVADRVREGQQRVACGKGSSGLRAATAAAGRVR